MGDKDFFLSPDDSQTLGDINYMRKSVRVKRTFPKTLANKDGFAIEKSVSADNMDTDDGSFNRSGAFKPATNNNDFATYQNSFTQPVQPVQPAQNNTPEQPVQPAPTPKPEERRKVDTNLDMFRNMARNIRKK